MEAHAYKNKAGVSSDKGDVRTFEKLVSNQQGVASNVGTLFQVKNSSQGLGCPNP
jgi:hypothetical protein